MLFRIVLLRNEAVAPHTVLELKPLKETEQNAYSTQQLFTILHGLAQERSLLHRLLNVHKRYSFEIVSTKNEGIRYVMRIPEDDADLIEKNMLSYLPGIQVRRMDDYLPLNREAMQDITEFRLSRHFALPLKKQNALDLSDPIAYITGNMTKLADRELVSLQLVVTPLRKSSVPDIGRVSRLIYTNKDLVSGLSHVNASEGLIPVLKTLVFLGLHILLLPVGLLVFVASEGREGPFLRLPFETIPDRTPNAYQVELEQKIKEKLDQQLFDVSIRLMVAGDNRKAVRRIGRGFISAFSSFSNSGYQALIPCRNWKLPFFDKIRSFLFTHRLLGMVYTAYLSVSEVTDIYHFPFSSTTKTENLVKLHYRELPAPLSLKQSRGLDICFARNTYGGTVTDIGMTVEERRRHMYILGATGTGKSTLLLSMVKQDIDNDKGICVIDPHGDLAEKILTVIPENRISDVIYFNPDDNGYPIGVNLLELTSKGSEEERLREKEFITESIISLFHKLYPEKYSGPRMEYILRNTIHTAFSVPGATLFTVYKLLTNTPYRKSVTALLTDENLKDFWKYEFSKAGDYQKVKMISPITNKIGRFLFSAPAKRILEQEVSKIDFDDIMDSGKILICNLSKGRIGEDTSEVFGILIMTKIQLAALKRARHAIGDRRDFFLYVDEFQNFATPSFAQILSEARKYRLNAILAHQTTSQLEETSLVNVTLANTGTVICFRTANPEDERLILPQFQPYIRQGEIANLPSYHFYMRISAINPEEPFSGETVPFAVPENRDIADRVIESSRMRYAIRYGEMGSIPSEITPARNRKSVENLPKQSLPEDRPAYQVKKKSVSVR